MLAKSHARLVLPGVPPVVTLLKPRTRSVSTSGTPSMKSISLVSKAATRVVVSESQLYSTLVKPPLVCQVAGDWTRSTRCPCRKFVPM